jgi:polyvinyl alcohol dehydrogenase (cytochrome)
MLTMRTAAVGLLLASWCLGQEGTRVFISRCIQCHDPNSDSHAPLPEALANLAWQDILKALETGSMKAIGEQLSAADRVAVARYLGKAGPTVLPEMKGFCASDAKPRAGGASWNGWGVDERNTRFQPSKAAGLTSEQVSKLQVKWAFGFPNTVTAYSQPTVVDGRVFTGSNDGTVYALDAETGCIYWRYQAKAMVRDAVVVGPGPRAYFGDLESNFYALDANTGKLAWQKKLDSQPFTRITGTAKLHDGRLYVPITSQEENAGANPQYSCCTFRGNLVAVKASDGSVVWRTYTTPEPKPTRKSAAGVQYYGPSGATIWSSPTLDLKRKLVYVAAGNGFSGPDLKTADAVIAMDMETGKIKWSQQTAPDMFNWGCAARDGNKGNCPENAGTDVDLGGSPVLLDTGDGKQILVQGQKSAEVHGLDPDQNGKILWSTRFGVGGAGGGIQWGIAAGDGLVFAGLGESPRGAQAASAKTGLFAFDPATGKIVWNEPAPAPGCAGQRGCSVAQKSPPAAIPGVVFSPSMDGHVRAHDSRNGKIIWDFDTARDFPTVNGIPAKGGSMASTGVTVANGIVYVNSGYSSMPGNVLLAFSAK